MKIKSRQCEFKISLYCFSLNVLVVLIISVSIPVSLYSQSEADSIFNTWSDLELHDTTRFRALFRYCDDVVQSDKDSLYKYASIMLDSAISMKQEKYEAVGMMLQGQSILNSDKNNSEKAINLWGESLIIFQKIGDRPLEARCLSYMGIYFWIIEGEMLKAVKMLEKAYSIINDENDNRAKTNIARTLGQYYGAMGLVKKQLHYVNISLLSAQQMGDELRVAHSLHAMADIYLVLDKFDEGDRYHEEALKIYEELDYENGIYSIKNHIAVEEFKKGNYKKALVLTNELSKMHLVHESLISKIRNLASLTRIYIKLSDLPSAQKYMDSTLLVLSKIEENVLRMSDYLNLYGLQSEFYQLRGDYLKAIEISNLMLDMAKENVAIESQRKANEYLYESYKKIGNDRKALIFYEQFQILEDSLHKGEAAQELQKMEFAKQVFEDSIASAKKKLLMEIAHREEVIKKDKTRNILIGSGLFAILLAGGFFSRWRYVKKSRDIISKEKDRSENLLLNILPAEIAEELKTKGEAAARDFDQVSILFTDFKEFTQLSEKLSPKELVGEINHCFKVFDGICEKYGIEKIKTIGDSFMAAGGLPVPKEDSVKSTVLAALEMAGFIVNRKLERESAGQLGFEMRTGIHTGNVVAGIVGVKKFQYDIWGDTVNTASRIESNAEVGRVNISQSTYEIIKDDPQFKFENRGKVQAKGKGEIEMWFVDIV